MRTSYVLYPLNKTSCPSILLNPPPLGRIDHIKTLTVFKAVLRNRHSSSQIIHFYLNLVQKPVLDLKKVVPSLSGEIKLNLDFFQS